MHAPFGVVATEDYVPAAATIADSLSFTAGLLLIIVAVVLLLQVFFMKRVDEEQAQRIELEFYEERRSRNGA